MCVVSMIGDHYHDKWDKWIQPANPFQPFSPTSIPSTNPNTTFPAVFTQGPTKEEFEELKKEVLEMKELLKKAIQYDIDNNEPHCEIEEKMATLKKVSEMVGVSLDDILPKGENTA